MSMPGGMKMKKEKKMLRSIELRPSENGGIIAEHRFSSNHPGEEHTFAAEEGHKLAAHLTKHMGMQISGNVADGPETEDAEA